MRRLLLAALVLFTPALAHAACASPAGVAGQVLYNTGQKVLEFCNGTSWVNLGMPNPGGGTSCTSPARPQGTLFYNTNSNVLEYCNGTNWVNMGTANPGASANCTNPAAAPGILRFNTNSGRLVYCNATNWVNAAQWLAIDSDPIAFSFTDLTNQVTSTQVTSNIIQITGINVSTTATTSGASSQIRSCADSTCTSVLTTWASSLTIGNNQYLQARQTTSASNGTVTTAIITIGAMSDSWTATTISCAAQGSTKAYLTSSGNWSVPANVCTITIDCIGGGANGTDGNGIADTVAGAGGGGGAFSRKNSYTVIPGASIAYTIGGAGGDTSFNTNVCVAKGGSGTTGGQAASGTGDVKYSGGNGSSGGGLPTSTIGTGGGGGGGAAGPSGAGSNGSCCSGSFNQHGGAGGGGDAGAGGGGGGGGTFNILTPTAGGAGGAGTEYGSYGSGGGGGGGAGGDNDPGGGNGAGAGTRGGSGGAYGAGGGGGGQSNFGGGAGGGGRSGLIVITY